MVLIQHIHNSGEQQQILTIGSPHFPILVCLHIFTPLVPLIERKIGAGIPIKNLNQNLKFIYNA